MSLYTPQEIENVSQSAFRACAERIDAKFTGDALYSLKLASGHVINKLRIGQKGRGSDRHIESGDIKPDQIELYGPGKYHDGISLSTVVKNPMALRRWAQRT